MKQKAFEDMMQEVDRFCSPQNIDMLDVSMARCYPSLVSPQMMARIEQGYVGDMYPGTNGTLSDVRSMFERQFGWAIPSRRAIRVLTHFLQDKRTLEVGAGKALYAYLLRLFDMDLIVTDSALKRQTFTHVITLDACTAVRRYTDVDVLMMLWPTWPSPDNTWSGDALALYQGRYFIYMGEGPHGVTGSYSLHAQRLDTSQWREILSMGWPDIPVWAGRHDSLHIYERVTLCEVSAEYDKTNTEEEDDADDRASEDSIPRG